MHDPYDISCSLTEKRWLFTLSVEGCADVKKHCAFLQLHAWTKLSTWGGNIGEDWNADREV